MKTELENKANTLFYKMLEENYETTSTEMMIEFHKQMLQEQLIAYENFKLLTPKDFSCSDECIDEFLKIIL